MSRDVLNTNSLFVALLAVLATPTGALTYCSRGDACWPSIWDVAKLSAALEPDLPRRLYWPGAGSPRVSAVPVASSDEQPLYGVGASYLQPVYTQTDSDRASTCFVNNHSPEYCCVSVRNTPYEGWSPAFVAWPVTTAHVQAVVSFARKHGLCLSVAGTGHDFLNRHSCDQGVLLRTALLKNVSFDLGANTVTVGTGSVFSEIEYAASQHGRYISSGWADTVGIVGWSIGGGHGPFAPSAGLGVDNIVAAEVVVANGSVIQVDSHTTTRIDADGSVSVSATPEQGLYWALRGGGGSAWGILTSLTLRTHVNPEHGFTQALAYWQGDLCADMDNLNTLIDKHMSWSLTLGAPWSGLTFATPAKSSAQKCGNWTFMSLYVYLGSPDDPEFKTVWAEKLSHLSPVDYHYATPFPSWWDRVEKQPLEPIIPVSVMTPSGGYYGGVPSVLVARQRVQDGSLARSVKAAMTACQATGICSRQELYQDITGNLGSPQDPDVAISPGMRTAMYHFVYGTNSTDNYELGPNSYFSESAYSMDDWQQRYWGSNYKQLLAVKSEIDPAHTFDCRHCVGSTL